MVGSNPTFLTAALLCACAPQVWSAPLTGPAAITQVVMHRSGCLGSCPIYTVTITAEGHVKFVGEHFVSKKGTAEWSVSPSDFAFLATSVERIDFFSLKERYRYAPDGCKSWVTDMPTLDIVVTRGAQRKHVSYYYGCKGIPASARIDWLGMTIDDVAGTYNAVGEEEEL